MGLDVTDLYLPPFGYGVLVALSHDVPFAVEKGELSLLAWLSGILFQPRYFTGRAKRRPFFPSGRRILQPTSGEVFRAVDC